MLLRVERFFVGLCCWLLNWDIDIDMFICLKFKVEVIVWFLYIFFLVIFWIILLFFLFWNGRLNFFVFLFFGRFKSLSVSEGYFVIEN